MITQYRFPIIVLPEAVTPLCFLDGAKISKPHPHDPLLTPSPQDSTQPHNGLTISRILDTFSMASTSIHIGQCLCIHHFQSLPYEDWFGDIMDNNHIYPMIHEILQRTNIYFNSVVGFASLVLAKILHPSFWLGLFPFRPGLSVIILTKKKTQFPINLPK